MKKRLLIALLIFTGGISIFIACQGPELFESSEENKWDVPVWNNKNRDRDAIAEARQWYNLHREETEFMVTRSGKYSLFKDMEPAWKQCYTRKTDEFTSIESGIRALGGVYLVAPDCEQRFKATGDKRYLVTQTRLIILKYKDGRDMIGFFMTLSPSAKYLETTKFRPFYSTYAQREKTFDGYIYYHDMQGRFVNGWKYTDGKATHALSLKNDSHPQTRSSSEYCVPVYEFECEQTEGEVNEEGEVVVNAECNYYYVGESCFTLETDDGTESDMTGENPNTGNETGNFPPNTGNLRPSGGGNNNSGGGEYVPNNQTGMSPELKALFKNQDIGPSGIAKLNAALAEVLKKTLYKTIYDYIVYKGGCHTIKYQENMMGVASIALAGNIIHLKFAEEEFITQESLEHEMFHMFQVYNNGITQATLHTYNGMLEFEQSLFRDIQMYMEVKDKWEEDANKWYPWACWKYNNPSDGDYKKKYMAWMEKITSSGEDCPTEDKLNGTDFIYWSNVYKEVDIRYGEKQGYQYGADYNITITHIKSK